MKKKIAINGFGRIGRNVFKCITEKYSDNLDVVAINDLSDPNDLAHLLKYDSVYGRYEKQVDASSNALMVDNKETKIFKEKDPSNLPWGDLEVDVVLECTGFFADYEGAKKHIDAGAKKVIISAPSKDPQQIPSFLLGVNEDDYNPSEHHIVDMGSCTTNCLAPVLKALSSKYDIESVMMTTIHSYTTSQNLVDGPHKDLRRARAAAVNIVPTTTGAAKATERVLPNLKGKLSGMALRVPTATVSMIDLVFTIKGETDKEEINNLLRESAKKENLKEVLGLEDAPLVSSDYTGSSFSAVVDTQLTASKGNVGKIVAWYDNEWGYSMRLADFTKYIVTK